MKLEGLKVVDLSWFLPGPYLTTALADHGATLQRLGLLAAYERSGDCAQAWLSVQAWRDEVRPRLEASLGPALASPPPAHQRQRPRPHSNSRRR